MPEQHRILQVGLGPIGLDMARRAVRRPGFQIVGAVDISPELRGKKLQDLLSSPAASGEVLSDLSAAIAAFRPEVALVTTVSDLERVVPTCETLLRAGVHVVSTCEEMAFPFVSQPAASQRIEAAGLAGRAACLGTGINPGFVLDFLPTALSAPMDSVTRLRAWRVVDAAKRRGPLQMKVGAGLSEAEFHAKVKAGGFGHRGFMESLHLLCTAFGLDPAGASTFIEPVVSNKEVKTEFTHVRPGQVAGIHQGAQDKSGKIVLDLKMYVGAEDPGDRIELEGQPDVKVTVHGGYHGDVATCAITLNAVPAIRKALPGFRSMLDTAGVHARFA